MAASALPSARTCRASGGLTKIGTGTLTLAGTNTYLGGTTISQGTLAVSTDSNLGDPGGALDRPGHASWSKATSSIRREAIILTDPAATIQVAPSFAYSNSGTISGTGGLTKNGAGLLVLNGPNTYSGGTTLAAGTLAVGNAGALGSGTLTITGGVLDASRPRHPFRPAPGLERRLRLRRQQSAQYRHLARSPWAATAPLRSMAQTH